MSDPQSKTVLINVHQGFSVRYLLQTGVFRRIKDQAGKVVIIASDEGEYLDEFRRMDNVEVEIVPREVYESYFKSSKIQRALKELRFYTYGARVTTAEVAWRFYNTDVINRPGRPFWRQKGVEAYFGVIKAAVSALGRFPALRKALLKMETALFSPPFYDSILDRHKPDIVVVSSLGVFDNDHLVMRAAKRKGIPTVSMIMGWDNTTTRGYPGAFADYVVAWTETMKEELIRLHDIEDWRVYVGGVPLFDSYYSQDPGYDREEFLESMKLDPRKKTIFLATRSPNSYPWNPNIVEILAEAVDRGDLEDCQVVARIHPLHYKRAGSKFAYQDALDAYDRIAGRFPGCVVLNVPKFASERVDYVMPEEEIELLTRLLRSCDVIATVFSTINIEGAIFDKPIVNVCFDNLPKHYSAKDKARFNIKGDFNLTHNQRIADSGGVSIAYTPSQLVERVNEYLRDPSLDSDGRRRIVDREAGPNRGRSAVATADFIMSL